MHSPRIRGLFADPGAGAAGTSSGRSLGFNGEVRNSPGGIPLRVVVFDYIVYIYRLFLSVCYFNHVKESTTEYFGAGRILAGPNSCLQRQQSLCLFH